MGNQEISFKNNSMNYTAYYINLNHRKDRLAAMEQSLKAVGLEATRLPGILPSQLDVPFYKIQVMLARTPGAAGCHYSQIGAMQLALEQGKDAFVMEDDLVFCSDFKERMEYIATWMQGNEWDVFWLGGTYHVNPPYWHTGRNPQLPGTSMRRDAERTQDPRIIRTYGCFSTYAYIVNAKSIEKVLGLLDAYVHESMGIDWLFIKLQPQLKTFAFAPGLIKQYDNKSDIGNGITYFSGFSKLGAYWWQDRAEQFDPNTFNWAEAKL